MFLSLSICARSKRQNGCDHPAMLPQPHTCATHMVPPINTQTNSSLCTFSLPSATELVFRKIAATRRPTNVAHAAKDENRRLGPGRGPGRVQGRTRGARRASGRQPAANTQFWHLASSASTKERSQRPSRIARIVASSAACCARAFSITAGASSGDIATMPSWSPTTMSPG